MRGIALPTETVIIIILAVVVMAAVIFFFTDIFVPGGHHVTDTFEKAKWCGEYVKIDSKCENDVPSGPEYKDLRDELDDVCDGTDAATLKICCSTYCPQ